MAKDDSQRWNARYAEGTYGERTHPAALVKTWVHEAPMGRALDVACGAGRNALYLAERGFDVTGVDISSKALELAAQRAQRAGLEVHWHEHDLDEVLPPTDPYALIVVVRYANLAQVTSLKQALQPGGLLLVEAHLGGEKFTPEVGGPGSERFRLVPGELAAACAGLEMLHSREDQIRDPDGRLMALAQFVGRAS